MWTSAALAQKLGREPSGDEIGRALKLTPSKVTAIRQALSASIPSGRGGSDDAPELEDLLAGIPNREEMSRLADYDREALTSALDLALTERERNIIEMRYGLGEEDPATLERIGERIGLTRERVRQIENQALQKLLLFLREKDEQDEIRRLAKRREQQRRREQMREAEQMATAKPETPAKKEEKPQAPLPKPVRRTRRLGKMRRRKKD